MAHFSQSILQAWTQPKPAQYPIEDRHRRTCLPLISKTQIDGKEGAGKYGCRGRGCIRHSSNAPTFPEVGAERASNSVPLLAPARSLPGLGFKYCLLVTKFFNHGYVQRTCQKDNSKNCGWRGEETTYRVYRGQSYQEPIRKGRKGKSSSPLMQIMKDQKSKRIVFEEVRIAVTLNYAF